MKQPSKFPIYLNIVMAFGYATLAVFCFIAGQALFGLALLVFSLGWAGFVVMSVSTYRTQARIYETLKRMESFKSTEQLLREWR